MKCRIDKSWGEGPTFRSFIGRALRRKSKREGRIKKGNGCPQGSKSPINVNQPLKGKGKTLVSVKNPFCHRRGRKFAVGKREQKGTGKSLRQK